MSELDGYLHRVVEIATQNGRDISATARRVRSLTVEMLARGDFLAAVSERVISCMELANGRSAPLCANARAGISIHAFVWPPGCGNEPHLHSAWSVTGVLHNEIAVDTFRGASTLDDVASIAPTTITAVAGQCGFLVPPCVHRLRNPSKLESITLHVFSAEPGTRVDGSGARLTGAREMTAKGARRGLLLALSRMLGGLPDPSVEVLLERVFALGSSSVKLQVVRALAQRDIGLAYARSRDLERHLTGRDRALLATINTKFGIVAERSSSRSATV